MNPFDDTRLRSVTPIAALSPDSGHLLVSDSEGKTYHAVTYEHAAEAHPEYLDGSIEMAAYAAPPERKGPPKVTSDAYRAGWDRIFGKAPAGEA